MAFCPKCRIEYRSGVTRCSDCGVELVPVLTEASDTGQFRHDLRLVKLTEFVTPAEADMIQELLEENDIPALVSAHSDPLGVVSGAQPVALFVAAPDLTRALEIYHAFFEQPCEFDEEVDTKQVETEQEDED